MRFVGLPIVFLCAALWPGTVCAQQEQPRSERLVQQPGRLLTVDDVRRWVTDKRGAEPAWGPGEAEVTYDGRDLLRPFIPPVVQHIFVDDPQIRYRIGDTRSYPLHPEFAKDSETNVGEVRLDADGHLLNYRRSGYPFPPSTLSEDDPDIATKVMWDFYYRLWTHEDMYMNWAFRWRKNPKPVRSMRWIIFEDHMQHTIATPSRVLDAEETDKEFKIFFLFESPYDIRGTGFLIYRYVEPGRDDDAWAYVPAIRRVRRVSMEQRWDSLMGTDWTINDFYGHYWRIDDRGFRYEYLGRKKILAAIGVDGTVTEWGGSTGWFPVNVRWELRDCYVVLMHLDKETRAPYAAKILFVDPEHMWAHWMLAFDRSGRIWKTLFRVYKWSEDFRPAKEEQMPEGERELDYSGNLGQNRFVCVGPIMIDLQHDRSTTTQCYTAYHNDTWGRDVAKLREVYSVSNLFAGHR
jgi:hypothetical protein